MQACFRWVDESSKIVRTCTCFMEIWWSLMDIFSSTNYRSHRWCFCVPDFTATRLVLWVDSSPKRKWFFTLGCSIGQHGRFDSLSSLYACIYVYECSNFQMCLRIKFCLILCENKALIGQSLFKLLYFKLFFFFSVWSFSLFLYDMRYYSST